MRKRSAVKDSNSMNCYELISESSSQSAVLGFITEYRLVGYSPGSLACPCLELSGNRTQCDVISS